MTQPPHQPEPDQSPGFDQPTVLHKPVDPAELDAPAAPARGARPWIVGGVVAVVIAVGATLFFMSGGGDSARDTAQKYVAALQSRDLDSIESVVCDEKAKSMFTSDDTPDINVTASLVDVSETGDTATATVDASVGSTKVTLELGLRKKSGDWCLSTFAPKG